MTESQIPKLLAVLVEHQKQFGGLSAEEAQWIIKNPKEAIGLLTEVVKKRFHHARYFFPIIFTYETDKRRDMNKILTNLGRKICDRAIDIMKQKDYKESIKTKTEKVEICAATIYDLTGKNVATTKEIYAAILAKDHTLCKPEDGPYICEVYSGDNTVFLAMKPIHDSSGEPLGFFVCRHHDIICLSADHLDPEGQWDGYHYIVFRR
ncbi:MAG: hypothetical protein UT05_C0005G0041 [Parcubacteria group bacterium GW2011_GWF2_38_76]|nr:MAG: hypothetical protein UT05_C0005G0041 [Parcubacteria group bacterium GW2011_GWF2_38_76]HBM45612.1 hypothetical protein [Patescibacteria group bacterium]